MLFDHAARGVGPTVARRDRSQVPPGRGRSPALAVLTVLALVTGCRTYTPMPLDPTAEWETLLGLGDTLSTGPPADHDAPPGEPEWFPLSATIDLADGLDLAEANAVALFHNPRLVEARHQVRVSGAQLLQAGRLENPDLFLGPRFDTDGGAVIFPASLSWELPIRGDRGARRDVARSDEDLARLELQDRELEVLVAVRRTFIDLWATSRELETFEALGRTTGRVMEWTEQLHAAGEIDLTTSWLASWERGQLEQRERLARAERRRLVHRLHRLLGLLPEAALEVSVANGPRLPDLPETDLAERRRHPRLRAAEERYARTEARLRLAIAEQYPSLRFGPEFEDDDGDTSIGFGLGIELPLFDRNRGEIAAAEAERTAARDHYRATLLALAHEEAEARADAALASELAETLRSGDARRTDEALRALSTRIDLGVSSVLEVLSAQRAVVEARLQHIALESERARATLVAAVAAGAALREPPVDEVEEGP